MSDTPVSTPKRKETAAGAGLDYTGIAVEICKYAESGKKIDWDDIAQKAGSASANSLRVCWAAFKKGFTITPKTKTAVTGKPSQDTVTSSAILKPKPSRVGKSGKKAGEGKAKPPTDAVEKVGDDIGEITQVKKEEIVPSIEEDGVAWGHEGKA